jgi:hypothetical protein
VHAGVFYPGEPTLEARRRIIVNVSHINSYFASTDAEIKCKRYGPYRVQKRKTP